MSYPVIEVPLNSMIQVEVMGTKRKFWYQYNENQKALFKEGRLDTGENWAEKVSCEIAGLLGLPHAEYKLARCDGKNGVISPSFVPENGRLILGNELLAKANTKYNPDIRYKTTQHTLRRVIAVLKAPSIGIPCNCGKPIGVTDALDVFVGYLLFDTLIGNQDRHHENWGLIMTPEHGLVLAPTFDHGSSLGRNETDEVRKNRLNTKDSGYSIENYVAKARSGFYEKQSSKKPMSTIDAFLMCANKANDGAKSYWLGRLGTLRDSDFSDILNKIPDTFISKEARSFALRMLCINRSRLLY